MVFAVSSDPALSEDDVVGMCRGRIASYKLPKAVYLIGPDEMPRTTTGKIQRHLLEQRLR